MQEKKESQELSPVRPSQGLADQGIKDPDALKFKTIDVYTIELTKKTSHSC